VIVLGTGEGGEGGWGGREGLAALVVETMKTASRKMKNNTPQMEQKAASEASPSLPIFAAR